MVDKPIRKNLKGIEVLNIVLSERIMMFASLDSDPTGIESLGSSVTHRMRK